MFKGETPALTAVAPVLRDGRGLKLPGGMVRGGIFCVAPVLRDGRGLKRENSRNDR